MRRSSLALALTLLASVAHAKPPPADRDDDGIADDVDRCPSDAEDKNDFEDDDGCPDAARLQERKAQESSAREHEQHEAERVGDVCMQLAQRRETSARGGYTSYDSAIDAWHACEATHPDAHRAALITIAITKLQVDRDVLAKRRIADDVAHRHALADDYAAKARVQYALGTTFGILAVGTIATALGFGLGQPLGRGEISNTIVGSVFLGFGILFGIQTYLRLDQAGIDAQSAKSIRPVALAPSGLVISF